MRCLLLIMKFWFNKYSRRISSITLACYLIVIILSIFHHHQYDLNEPKAFTTENTETASYNADLNSGFDCAIQHNLTQLHNFNLEFEASINFFVQNVEKFSSSDSNSLIPSTSSFPKQLRAPPSYS